MREDLMPVLPVQGAKRADDSRTPVARNQVNDLSFLAVFNRLYVTHLPGISLPPQKQSGNRQTSLRHFAAVLSGVGMG
uniref:Uncharacterized protein n=1 Tax=Glossina austeni TaxID=7395 RepID=A0A1A9V8Y2_GLOAU